MIDIKKIKKGQMLCLVRRIYERGIHNPEMDRVDYVEVTKVGRRYITIKVNGVLETFDSYKDFREPDSFFKRMKKGLYLCASDYFNELEATELIEKILVFFRWESFKSRKVISVEDLTAINNILKKYKTGE